MRVQLSARSVECALSARSENVGGGAAMEVRQQGEGSKDANGGRSSVAFFSI